MNKATLENIRIALRAVRSQALRSTITILIIALGLTALVGIMTAITAIQTKFQSDLSLMGSNSFTIMNRQMGFQSNGDPKRVTPISFYQTLDFKDIYNFPATVSISAVASPIATVKFKSKKTNPNVRVLGVDEAYISTSGYSMELGRNFSRMDQTNAANVVILGQDIVKKLFDGANNNPVGQVVAIGASRYLVVGTLKEKGSSFGFKADNQILIPVSNLRVNYQRPSTSYSINVMVKNAVDLDRAVAEATGKFRIVRKDPPGKESSFFVSKSDSLAEMVISELGIIRVIGMAIAFITLLGAAIGLMNIMLVSVTERTREIGTRKAIGASAKAIRQQFLIESIVIGQLGGIFGIIFGVIIGNVVAYQIGSEVFIPWDWVIGGAIICLIVGVVSGYYPANKASKLDPIEALRHE